MSFVNSVGNTSRPPLGQQISNGPTSQIPARAVVDQPWRRHAVPSGSVPEAQLDSSFRAARARAIRAEILNRTYETPERIEKTVERLLDVIG